jgi:hypothetical protein
VKRILTIITVTALFALLLVVAGLPAVADPNCNTTGPRGTENPNCVSTVVTRPTTTTITHPGPVGNTTVTLTSTVEETTTTFQPGAKGKGNDQPPPTTTTT